ncbi:CDGSH iron-sulfur domain-containing protein 2 [Ophiophagus hannah]|uniref:CDGSH iron-sulfur domain-containing protein 2 n=1 Tax=Ophiophagus hannah TaxID=8665 RepID=V8PCV9_OPHHA|nr:CDGSH iron-sulfur domain-containing protein 2 [Ophiophagus hannah]
MVLDSLARIVKVQLPAYLKRLPLPESVGGFLRLTEYCSIIWLWHVLSFRMAVVIAFPGCPCSKKQQKDSLINLKIQKENPKVVNKINTEDLCHTKAVYCRCWRSKTVIFIAFSTLVEKSGSSQSNYHSSSRSCDQDCKESYCQDVQAIFF